MTAKETANLQGKYTNISIELGVGEVFFIEGSNYRRDLIFVSDLSNCLFLGDSIDIFRDV